MAVSHVFTNAIADGTNVSIVRPSDWNSVHVQAITLSGNTAGVSSVTGTNIVFGGSNNVTISGVQGVNAGTINLSVGPADGVNILAAGSQTANTTGSVLFQNSNGVTFGMSNSSVITASYTVPTITSWTVSDAVTSQTIGRLAFTNANGLTLTLSTSNNGNATVVGSYTVPTVTNSSMTVSDNATSGTLARLAFTNLNGVTLSLSTGAGGSHTIVGSHNGLTSQSNQAFSAAGGSSAFQTLGFSDNGAASFTNTNGSVAIASVRASMFATSNTTQSSTMTVNLNSVILAGAGNLSVGLTNGSVVISAPNAGSDTFQAVGNTTSNSSGTFANDIYAFSGAGAVSVGVTNNTVIISAPTGAGGTTNQTGPNIGVSNLGNTAGSTGTVSTGNVVFVGTNGITLSQSTGAVGSNATITIKGPNSTLSHVVVAPFGEMGGPLPFAQSSSSFQIAFVHMVPVVFDHYVTADHVKIPMFISNSSSAAASIQKGITTTFGIYTRNATNATVLAQHYSSSYTMAASHNSNASWMLSMITAIGNSTSYNTVSASSAGVALSASLHGQRELIIPISSLFTPGEYWFALLGSSSSVGGGGSVLVMSNLAAHLATFNRPGLSTGSTNFGFHAGAGAGQFSTTTGALPSNITISDIRLMSALPIMFLGTGTV